MGMDSSFDSEIDHNECPMVDHKVPAPGTISQAVREIKQKRHHRRESDR
jgi:hypothetical protein